MKTKFRSMFLSIFSLMLVVWMASASFVQAGTNTESGVVITVTTDKQEYQANEKIEASITLKNKNDVAAESVSVECTVPDGYKAEGSTTMNVEKLEGEDTVMTMVVTFAPLNAAPEATDAPAATEVPAAEESNNTMLWVGIAILVIAVVVVLCVVLRKKNGGKNSVKMLALILGGSLVFSGLSMNAMDVSAAPKECTVSAAEVVKVAGADVTIGATATYTIEKVDLNELLNVKEFDEENAIIVEAESYIEASSVEPYIKEEYEGEAVKCNGGPTLLTWEVTIEKDGTYQFTTIGTGMQSTVGIPIVGNVYINDELIIESTLNTNEKFNPWVNPLRSQLGAVELKAGTYKITFESFLGCYIMDKLAIEPKIVK